MEGPATPPPENPENNANDNDYSNNNDNNLPADPLNAPQQQPPSQANQPPQINLHLSCPLLNNLFLSSPQPQPVPANPTGWPQPFLQQTVPHIIHQQIVNWSHLKPEFVSKPEEDAEAHLLHTNNWMRTHNFNEGDKVQRFCLTLLGEDMLWYETLTPIANEWPALQNAFR